MGDYPDRYEDKYGDGRYRNTVAENKPKAEEVFGPQKVSSFLRQALETGDTNSDGTLSRREFDEYQKTVSMPLTKQTAQFVSKHFGSRDSYNVAGISG